jgi:phage-related protein
MESWRVEVLNEAVRCEIAALPQDIRAKLAHIVEMIEAVGPHRMRAPHVKHLRDKLWEMRMSGRDGIARAIYLTSKGRRVIIVHAFIKKTQRTPSQAIWLAQERSREVN